MEYDRRAFFEVLGAAAVAASAQSKPASAWRDPFPALTQQVGGQPLAYLDSAATTLRPREVIDAVARFDAADNANPGASLHALARRSAERFTAARQRIARFLHAADASEIVLTKGTTEAINLAASTWGAATIKAGDEIVLTTAEHYSNLLPWRVLAERTGARIVLVDVDDDGRLSPARVRAALTARTRLVAFSHVSNVLGIVNPAPEICAVARARGVPVLIDAAQSAPHMALDVSQLGCDFLACSSHKMLGPMGVGVLWARAETLDRMPAYQLGSNMAHDVEAASARYEHGSLKYQAGTPNVSGAIGLATGLEVLDRIGLDNVRRHDTALVEHAREQFRRVPSIRVLGTLADSANRLPLFTFTLGGVPPGRIVQVLDAQGIAVRAGDMAALPLLKRFGTQAAVRASCYLYTTTGEIDRFVTALAGIVRNGD